MADSTGVDMLPEHICWMLLRASPVARLAVIIDGQPDIFPINFVVDHGTIVFRTAEGSKLSALVSNAVVAFEVDGHDEEADEAWSVIIKGHAEEIKKLHERIDTMDLPLFPWHATPKSHFLRIVPDIISGRRFHVVEKTAWNTPTTGARHSPQE